MKWKKKKIIEQPDPVHGDTRMFRKFLWLPLTINDETRWLESVWIVQKYVKLDLACGVDITYWEDYRFMDGDVQRYGKNY